MPDDEIDKTRFSARVRADTFKQIDEFANNQNLNRSRAIEELVAQWDEQRQDETPQTLREQLRHAVAGQTVEWVLVMVVSVILSFVAPLRWVSIAALGLSAMGIVLALAGLWFDIKATLLPSLTRSPGVQEVSE